MPKACSTRTKRAEENFSKQKKSNSMHSSQNWTNANAKQYQYFKNNIPIQCDLLFNKLIGKNQKKEVLTDNIGLISKFYNGLHNEKQFMDFINLAKGLLDGKIKWHNMAWTGALHMGRFICLYNNL